MSLRLVCDHCDSPITDAEFREVQRSVAQQDSGRPDHGVARGHTETYHYHSACMALRVDAADATKPNAPPADPLALEPGADHPMTRERTERADAAQERQRLAVGSDGLAAPEDEIRDNPHSENSEQTEFTNRGAETPDEPAPEKPAPKRTRSGSKTSEKS